MRYVAFGQPSTQAVFKVSSKMRTGTTPSATGTRSSNMSNRSSKGSKSSKTSNSSCNSTFSYTSKHTAQTALSSHSSRPPLKHYDSAPHARKQSAYNNSDLEHKSTARDSVSSVATYASTQASHQDLSSLSLDEFPKERYQTFDPDATPSSPGEFAQLFPSTRRIMIQHDDSTTDGNMNLRVDTEAATSKGRKRKTTLFHLRMKDIAERQFSLRRYWRNSGREVCTSKRRYVKPVPAEFQPSRPFCRRVSTDPCTYKRPLPPRQDSGYESDEDDELEESLRAFTMSNNIKATLPTDAIRVEFSNYAQIILEPRQRGNQKQYDFEYWGEYYSWKRKIMRDGDDLITAYELINIRNNTKVSSIVPDALSSDEAEFEASQGSWVPACSMRILQRDVPDDLGDVIVATGLLALTDDCVPKETCQI